MNVRQLFPPPDFKHTRLSPELERQRHEDLVELAERAVKLGIRMKTAVLVDRQTLTGPESTPEWRRQMLDLQMDHLELLISIRVHHANSKNVQAAAP